MDETFMKTLAFQTAQLEPWPFLKFPAAFTAQIFKNLEISCFSNIYPLVI